MREGGKEISRENTKEKISNWISKVTVH
jgi:hypothetical protein